MHKLDGDWGGDLSFEVLKLGGLHLVITDSTEVVPVSGGADREKKVLNLMLFRILVGD